MTNKTHPADATAVRTRAEDTAAVSSGDVPRRTTSIYFPVPLLDELDELADRLERSRTWIVEKAVREWLAKQTE